MEFTAPLKSVSAALDIARFATNSAAPALAGVHVVVSEGTAQLTAYDGDAGARVAFATTTASDGAGILPRSAVDYIHALPGGDVHVAFTEASVTVSSGQLSATMRTEDPAHYPNVSFNDSNGVELQAPALRTGIRQVRSAAAAATSTRHSLAGVLFEAVDSELKLVTTDGYRLAIASVGPSPLEAGARITVPIKAVAELERLLAKASTVKVHLSELSACFDFGDVKMTTRLIAEAFPNYAGIIPASTTSPTVQLQSDDILESIKRLKIVAPRENRSIRISSANGVVSLSSTAAGDTAVEPIAATIDGDVPDFAVNVDYLADAVSALGSETVRIAVSDPLKPLLVTDPANTAVKQVMMPIRV